MAARYEYFVALLSFLALVTVSSRSRSQQVLPTKRGTYLWPVCLLVATAALIAGIYLKGEAPNESRLWTMGRSWSAFGQHFSEYQLIRTNAGGNLDPWADWELIVGRTFPHAHSLLGAAVTNPRAFLGFELHNLITAPRVICLYPTTPPYAGLKGSVICLTLMWMSFITLTSVSVRRRALFTSASALGPYVLSGATAAIPGILITPKINYFLPLLFVLFVGAVKWCSVVLENEPAVYRSVAAVSAVLLSLTVAAIRSPCDVSKGAEKPLLLEISEIRAILERQGVGGVRILQMGVAGYAAYLSNGLSEDVDVYDRRDPERFWDFLQRAHIDAIVVDDRLRSSRRYRDDPDFALFLASPDQFGWIAAPVGTRGDVFYLRGRRQNSLR